MLVDGPGYRFDGNLCHLFQFLQSKKEEYGLCVYFLTCDKNLYFELSERYDDILYYPSFTTYIKMLRAQILVVDANGWGDAQRRFFLMGAKKIQIWHGNGMKAISQLDARKEQPNSFLRVWRSLNNVFNKYDLVVWPSKLQEITRGSAFNTKYTFINGQPRNDVMFSRAQPSNQLLTQYGGAKKIYVSHQQGFKILFYMPTWRRDQTDIPQSILMQSINWKEIAAFLESHRMLLVFKLHPSDTLDYGIPSHPNFIELDKRCDIYPLLSIVDLLITDYSSIYMDYLMLNRPLIFFPYDLKEYLANERDLLYDYDEITPGRKCINSTEIIEELSNIFVNGNDEYVEDRARVNRMFNEYQDGHSSERLYDYIKQNYF